MTFIMGYKEVQEYMQIYLYKSQPKAKWSVHLQFCICICKMMLVAVSLLLLKVVPSFTFETYKVSEGVYSFTDDGFYMSMFVVTGEGVMVIEPVRLSHSKLMLQAIRNITNEPIKYLFYSHNHWDRTLGGQVFKDVGATIIAHEEAYDKVSAI